MSRGTPHTKGVKETTGLSEIEGEVMQKIKDFA
jgi:hypothetical protein